MLEGTTGSEAWGSWGTQNSSGADEHQFVCRQSYHFDAKYKKLRNRGDFGRIFHSYGFFSKISNQFFHISFETFS